MSGYLVKMFKRKSTHTHAHMHTQRERIDVINIAATLGNVKIISWALLQNVCN